MLSNAARFVCGAGGGDQVRTTGEIYCTKVYDYVVISRDIHGLRVDKSAEAIPKMDRNQYWAQLLFAITYK